MDFQLNEYQRMLVDTVASLARREFAPRAYTWEGSGRFPYSYLKILAEHDLTGITIPEADGGQGRPMTEAVLVIETVSQYCPTAGDCVQATNFGAIQQIARLGSPELKAKHLKRLLAGEGLVSVGMSEPEAGSAVTELRTSARVEGDQVIINGQKLYNTNGPYNSHWVVWVRFGPSTRDIGAVLVEKGAPGLQVTTHRFMSGEEYGVLFFDDCRVPVENILAQSDAFKRLMSNFNIERLGNAARSLALGQVAFDLAVAHAKERRQFGRRLCEFQGLQWKFADMKLKLESARLLLYRAAANADAGAPSPLESSLAKLACNQAGFDVANEAMQILGGLGYSEESRVNYIFRRTRGWQIAGGTLEQMRNRIAADIFGENFPQHAERRSSSRAEG